jgi:two-component system OmpR family sensor kinase/two-component system sensor histidine kinase BaeS
MNKHRRFVFWGFLAMAGSMALFFFTGIIFIIWLISGNFPPDFQNPQAWHFNPLACLIPIFFFTMASAMGRVGFRRYARPFAEIMAATDAIGRGDLSVRINEQGPRPIREMARRFNRMTAELAHADQQRRNLTADVAHELRNPLHIIQGNLEGMLDGVYEPTPENLSATLDETRLLSRLVADLQTLSLAESGQLPLHPTRFLLADLLADVAASFSPRAAEQGVEIRAGSAPELYLHADYDRLDQVLSNLVANALRHTPSGGSISLKAESALDVARIIVADNGSGIPAADLPFIFDRFWKGDRARTRDGAGSGLGLAIARQLVRAHGGDIDVESQPGQGTVFTLSLPLSVSQE